MSNIETEVVEIKAHSCDGVAYHSNIMGVLWTLFSRLFWRQEVGVRTENEGVSELLELTEPELKNRTE